MGDTADGWLTIQTLVGGDWHDAARVAFHDLQSGHRGATTTSYSIDYFAEMASVEYAEGMPLIDHRAVSVAHPVDLVDRRLPHWPAFLMDMLPQGLGRHFISKALGLNPILASTEVPLLAYAGGAPIGNLRIREAFENEARPARVTGIDGLPVDDILGRSDRLLALLTSLPGLHPSAVNLQGEWPKAMITRGNDGLYYPSGLLPDGEVADEFVLKMERAGRSRDGLILELEAVYSKMAGDAGLCVHRSSIHGKGVLLIPRFDRTVTDGLIRVCGQESIVSAMGVAEFAHTQSHEEYLAMIVGVSSQPFDDALEYVRRDIFNLCFGNDDNHGRNTALSKHPDGTVRLSPIYDLAPMRLAGEAIARSSKWEIMNGVGSDFRPDWGRVLRKVAELLECDAAKLASVGDFAEKLPGLAAAAVSACSDRSAAAHATSRLDQIVRDVTSASDGLARRALL